MGTQVPRWIRLPLKGIMVARLYFHSDGMLSVIKLLRIAIFILFQSMLCSVALGEARFEISFDKGANSDPITGRILLVIAHSDRPEPRLQIAPNTMPIFGVDVDSLQPGQAAIIDQTTFGHPVESLSQMPAGAYDVQAIMNVLKDKSISPSGR